MVIVMSSETNGEKPWHDRETLVRHFIEENLEKSELAERWGTSLSTIGYWLDKYDIIKPWKDEETLRQLYFEDRLTTAEIGDRLGCSGVTVQRWMDKLDLERRKRGTYDRGRGEPWQDEETLRNLYLEQDMSQSEVAEELGCTAKTICDWMRKYNIPITDARGQGDLSASDTPAPFTHVSDGTNVYEMWALANGNHRVHRLLAVAEYGFDALDGMHVHHKNGISWDNRPDNLEVLTPKEHRLTHVKQDQ